MLLEGHVNENHEPRVSLLIRGPITQTEARVEATLDTGFNDYLTLSLEQVAAMALPAIDIVRVVLADGSVISTPIFGAEVFWMRQWRNIEVQGGGDPLVGMLLVEGCRLTVEAWVGGLVRIEARTSEGESQ